MREIIFRAWDNIRNELFYFDINRSGSTEAFRFINNIPIMQYTGLKDKNGKEIYEGDILKEEGVVFFKDGAFQVDNYPMMNFFIYGSEERLSKLEIIGNIYENPELLDLINS